MRATACGRRDLIGRQLDVLTQELNHKAILAKTSQCAVELKVIIEQIREQVQNIE